MVQSRRLRWIERFSGICLTVSLSALAFPAGAEDVRCSRADVIVVSPKSEDVDTICRAAVIAATFMADFGMPMRRPATVRIVEKLTQRHFASSLGAYDGTTNHVELLSYAAARRLLPERPAFGVPMNPELYRSFIVHEIAHAIVQPNFVRRPDVAAQEYIAYAVQFATMPKELRNSILRNVDTEGYERLSEISDMLLSVDPTRFAVKSYLHFIHANDGAAVFHHLLTGWF